MSDNEQIEPRDFNVIKAKGDQLRKYISLKNNTETITTVSSKTVIEDYPQAFTWRELFLKLCFEQMLQYFPQH